MAELIDRDHYELDPLDRIEILERAIERLKRGVAGLLGGGGVTDHGGLTGLNDDDHGLYLNEARHGALTSSLHDPKEHGLGGSLHSSATLAEFNALITDATLDDDGDTRDPTSHASSHKPGGSDEIEVPPVGTIVMYGGTTSPTGWLLCDGAAISRSTYSDLFAVVGELFGSGDGSTTFNLPDLRGRFPIGAESGGDHELGDTGGENESDLSHSHGVFPGEAWTQSFMGTIVADAGPWTTTTSGLSDHENRPAFVAVNFIIKV
jgi:microcystin-dependent protein